MRLSFCHLILALPLCVATSSCHRGPAFAAHAGLPRKPLKYVFDVPSLLAKNIDQVTALLGGSFQVDAEPTATALTAGHPTWERSFRRDTTLLFVTYHAQTRQIFHVFLSTAQQKTVRYASLLELGNLWGDEPRLVVEPRRANDDSGRYRGVWVGQIR